MAGELLRSSDTKRKLCHNPFNKHQQRFLLFKQNAVVQALRDFFHNVNIPGVKGNYNCQSRSFHQIFHCEIKRTSSALVTFHSTRCKYKAGALSVSLQEGPQIG